MIHFRPFKNADPPLLTELWNSSGLGPGAARDFPNDAFDHLVLSEPYFDKRGLIVACDESEVVGFVHAGFGANPEGTAVAFDTGVIAAVLVRLDSRRRGIGKALVSRAEEYLRESGARQTYAGESGRRNPFYMGLYGGAESAGFLDSDANAAPFFTALGYAPAERHLVFRRDIASGNDPFDPRALTIKRVMVFGAIDRPPNANWWWMTRYARFEPLSFALVPKSGAPTPAWVTCWGMELHGATREQRTVGLTGLFVAESERRKGYARVLLSEVIRRLRAELVTNVQAVVRDDNTAAIGLLRSLAFEQVDAGTVFRKGG